MDYLFDQVNLELICKDRLLDTCEIHEPNDFYGQASVVKEYLGLPRKYPLKAVFEHSFFLDDWMWDADKHQNLPVIFSSSRHRTEIHRKYTNKISIPIGYGYLYAIKNMAEKYPEPCSERKGTVAFPSHSTHHIEAVFDYSGYARHLASLPEKYQPVSVCIYWKDYLRGINKYYEDEGLEVLSAGHIFDNVFFYRFHDICRRFLYSTSNELGGAVFLSAASGCQYFFSEFGAVQRINPNNYELKGDTELFNTTKAKFCELFADKYNDENYRQDREDFIKKFLGSSYVKKKYRLFCLVIVAELFDKFIFTKSSEGKTELPCYFKRINMFRKIYGKIVSIINLPVMLADICASIRRIDESVKEMRYDIDILRQSVGRFQVKINGGNNGLPTMYASKVYSQFGEDGIIQYLINNIEIKNKTFVEFGVQRYTEANTRFLLINNNWSGLVIDGCDDNINYIKNDIIYWKYNLKAVASFVTVANINCLLKENGIAGEIGLLSVDIDGNDYWVWQAMEVISPAVVVVEYNHRFGFEKAVTIPYRPDFVRTKAHSSGIYYGSSLKALCLLGDRKGYDFVGCNDGGNNAFFIRKELRPEFIRALTPEEGFVAGQFREARDETGGLTFLSIEDEQKLLASLPLEKVEINHE